MPGTLSGDTGRSFGGQQGRDSEASRGEIWTLANPAVAIGEFLARQPPHERNDWK
jgi:hypothetical protein